MEEDAKKRSGDLFRAEAVEHRGRGKGPGDVVRVAPPWTTAAFYALVACFVAAVGALTLIEIDRYVRGATAVDEEGRLVVLVPAALAPDVPRGAAVELGDETTEVTETEESVLYPDQVRERFGLEVEAPTVVVVTSADGETTGTIARVRVEREPVIVALVPGLEPLFGDDDG